MDLAHLDQLAHALLDYLLYPFITLLMCLLSVFVVLGNLLVVTAIWHENQLHSVTNYLIASLAAADCLVGALVMPFSIISEMIIGSWTFGPVLCDLWHSLDVLASTASIMNLCAISLDRYLAITNPICYPTKMTPKRVALLIVSLWTCSSLISFPAILWWHAVGDGPLQQVGPVEARTWPTGAKAVAAANNLSSMIEDNQLISNRDDEPNRIAGPPPPPDESLNWPPHSSNSLRETAAGHEMAPPPEARYKCPFTDDTYYLLFSSFVSFYGPLCVMLYAYICIYRAAVQQTRFLKYGSKQVSVSHTGGHGESTSGGGSHNGSGHKKNKRLRHASERAQAANCDNYEQHLVLRVHRGGGGGGSGGGTNNLAKLDSAASKRAKSQHKHKQQQRQLASPTDEDGDDEDEDESETNTRRNDQMAPSSLDQTSTLSESLANESNLQPDSGARPAPSSNSSGRPLRSNLMMSQRDKLRVESQRFDPPSNSSTSGHLPLSAKPSSEPKTPGGRAAREQLSRQANQGAASSRKLFTTGSSTSSSGSSCEASQLQQVANRVSAGASVAPAAPAVVRQTDMSHHFRLVRALRAGNPQAPPQLPASLVPLIMMNSDTSTDSSIVTVVTRPIGDTTLSSEPAAGANPEPVAAFAAARQGPETVCVEQTVAGASGSAGGIGAKMARQVTINLGFEDDALHSGESAAVENQAAKAAVNKGQILHYNSDKLIQSIVDLSNIHYIDCAAQARTEDNDANDKADESDTLQGEELTSDRKSIDQLAEANSPESSKLLTSRAVASTRVVAHSKQGVEVIGGGGGGSGNSGGRQQRSVGKKLTKLAKERKAAKTLGIVVGVFILCWLPFFVVNIMVAICGLKCIYKPDILFSVVTWLGWLNSAMNPVIYACWSRDFRRAFRRVLCTWVEFLCWDGARLARKLKLKKGPNYSNSSAQRSGASIEVNVGGGGGGGVGSQSSGGQSKAAVLRTNSSNNSHKILLAD